MELQGRQDSKFVDEALLIWQCVCFLYTNALLQCHLCYTFIGFLFSVFYNTLNMNMYRNIFPLSTSTTIHRLANLHQIPQVLWQCALCTADWWWQNKDQENGSSLSLSLRFLLPPSLFGGAWRFRFWFLQRCSERKYAMSTTSWRISIYCYHNFPDTSSKSSLKCRGSD